MAKTVKNVVKRSTGQKKEKPDARMEIFQKLRKILSKYSPPLVVISDFDSRYELVSKKEVEFNGRKYDQMYFGATIIQSNYVGLYLMHVYAQPGNVDKISPELRKCLKGKSCFHIQSADDKLMKQVETTVRDGIECYKKLKFM